MESSKDLKFTYNISETVWDLSETKLTIFDFFLHFKAFLNICNHFMTFLSHNINSITSFVINT